MQPLVNGQLKKAPVLPPLDVFETSDEDGGGDGSGLGGDGVEACVSSA